MDAAPRTTEPGQPPRWPLAEIEDALRGLQFGTVTVTVQDGVVVQVERTEKKRFARSKRHA
jgi:hypothetical protein